MDSKQQFECAKAYYDKKDYFECLRYLRLSISGGNIDAKRYKLTVDGICFEGNSSDVSLLNKIITQWNNSSF